MIVEDAEMAAVVLSGGRARRMGGTAKTSLEVGGRSLLLRAVTAARRAGCTPVIVVGPRDAKVVADQWMREDPPFGGPVAAIAAALPAIEAPWTLVLAADLPRAEEVAAALLAAPRSAHGVRLEDADGRPQWLAAIYRTSQLRRAASLVAAAGASMRDLTATLDLGVVRAAAGVTADVDTWEDLSAARRTAHDEENPP